MSFVEFAGTIGGFGALGVLTEREIAGGIVGGIILPRVAPRELAASSSEAALVLPIPGGAVVTRAVARVAASMPGPTNVGGIATVRAASGDPAEASDTLIVDFGTLRTVSSVQSPTAVSSVTPWVGTKFDGALFFEGFQSTIDFTEIQTERLLVSLARVTQPDAFAGAAGVTTTTPPADLELSVGATRVWFRPGPVPAAFSEDIDVTAAVQAAVDAGGAPDDDGNLPVRLVLRARVPGKLSLAVAEDVGFLRTITVDFPGPTATLRFAEEGRRDLALPLPEGSSAWTIHRVVATVDAEDPGPLRVVPPVGPAPSPHAELVLDADRRLVAQLPAGPLGRLEAVAGVRVLLAPEVGGIEVGGALLGGTALEPGAPLPDATFTPVAVPAGAQSAWATLALPRPLEPPADETLWASLSVTRGRAVLGLSDAASVEAGELATLRRIAPNGIAHPPSTAVLFRADPAQPATAVRADALALRVVGVAPDDRPVAVVEVDLGGGPTDRAPGGPGVVAISPNPAGARSPAELRVTATAATTVTVGPVVVAYTEPGGPP